MHDHHHSHTSHDFVIDHTQAEQRTTRVMLLTAVMMVVEIIAGSAFGSMALLADGWHMATHVGAFGIALFAYRYARKHAESTRFTYGTGKVSVLGGFASAVALAVIALFMALESVVRLFKPQVITFDEAIWVAVLGLIVNLVSGLMLKESHDHGHSHGHDHNLRAAYFHVLADALTSVFAIIALLSGKYFGWNWLDPVMGIVGALVITRWSMGLLSDTSALLLDGNVDSDTLKKIRSCIEVDADTRLEDMHVWHISPYHLAVNLSVEARNPQSPDFYKKLLHDIPGLSHIMVEVIPTGE